MKDIKLWLQAKVVFKELPIDELIGIVNLWAERNEGISAKEAYLQGLRDGLSYFTDGKVPAEIETAFSYPAKDSKVQQKKKEQKAKLLNKVKTTKPGENKLWN